VQLKANVGGFFYSASLRSRRLLGGSDRFVEASFATTRRVAMNDSPFGSLIDGGNDCTNFIGIRRLCGAYSLLHSSQLRFDALVTMRTA
jgi:hypothetical protein